jgi:hypothetical protein
MSSRRQDIALYVTLFGTWAFLLWFGLHLIDLAEKGDKPATTMLVGYVLVAATGAVSFLYDAWTLHRFRNRAK